MPGVPVDAHPARQKVSLRSVQLRHVRSLLGAQGSARTRAAVYRGGNCRYAGRAGEREGRPVLLLVLCVAGGGRGQAGQDSRMHALWTAEKVACAETAWVVSSFLFHTRAASALAANPPARSHSSLS